MGLDSWIEKYVRSNALNYEKGHFNLLGLDGVVIPAATWTAIFEQFHSIDNCDAFEAMFEIGVEHGKLGVEEVGRSNQISRLGFVDKVMEAASVMGMGVIEVEIFDPEDERVVITINESPLNDAFESSEAFSDLERPIHQFWRGVFHKISEELFESEVRSEEMECEFLGSKECVIKCVGAE